MRASPTAVWETAPQPERWDLEEWCDPLFSDFGTYGETWAVAVAHRGRLVYSRYDGRLPGWGSPGQVVGPETGLLSWSTAKSVLHALVGRLVASGRLRLDQPPGVPGWGEPDDPRRLITLDHLLTMRDGLDFVEDYDPDGNGRSDVIKMLFGGVEDMAAFAADRGVVADPGTRYNYSSGTSNIVSGVVARLVGGGPTYQAWMRAELFDLIGMRSAAPEFDQAGTWVASSYLRATATDWLRFGELYLRNGVWDGRALLPPGWVDHARTARSADPDGGFHGAHWWTDDDNLGTFWAEGYEGQFIIVCPTTETVIVRFGRTGSSGSVLAPWRRDLVQAMADRL
jgi:CubicO group peptidase (beta-lactamase class C family)